MNASYTALLRVGLPVLSLVAGVGCQGPDYTLGIPCTELTPDAGGTSATFQSPTSVDSYTLGTEGVQVVFTAHCLPEGATPALRLSSDSGTSVQTVDSSLICVGTEADLYGATNWDCATTLDFVANTDCSGLMGSTTLSVIIEDDVPEDAFVLAQVDTRFNLVF